MENTIQNIPFLRLAIILALVILLGSAFPPITLFLLLVVIVILLFLSIIINRLYSFRLQNLFGITTNLLFLLIGIYIYQAYNKRPIFYKNGSFAATFLEKPQGKTNSYKAVAEINSFTRNDSAFFTHEQIIVYFSKESNINNLQAGDILYFNTNPQHIKNFGNPYEFDYRKFLERKKIYRQIYLGKNSWLKSSYTKTNLSVFAEKTRQKLINIYKTQPIDKREFEILSALTLGYKRDLDPETKRAFSSAGAMHVLAVSGLHVGIIYLVIILLLGYLRKRKNGRLIFAIVSICTLWCYAFITGFSPSVLRATTMFTIVIFGETLHRKSNVYNSLAASAFILLLFNPNNLFETGFQLSYSAVFGIVYLHPKFRSIVNIKNKILLFFLDLLIVSVAAQIATVPFILYYFGQFPSYFLVTNILIIPVAMFLIPIGMFLLLISGIPPLASFIASIIDTLIKFIFQFLIYIDQLPFSVLQITISKMQALVLITIILIIFILLKTKRTLYLHFTLAGIVVLIFTFIYTNATDLNKNELIIYPNSENATIELIHNKLNYVISEKLISKNDQIKNVITQTTQKRHLRKPQFFTLNNDIIKQNLFLRNGLVCFEGETILFGGASINYEKYVVPDLIINPINWNQIDLNNKNEEIIITNKRFIPQKNNVKNPFHYTTFESAFRKIW